MVSNRLCAVNESFNDTALNASSVSWIGQSMILKINVDHQLQSIGNANGISTFIPISLLPSMEWQCWLKLNFAPSERISLESIFMSMIQYYPKADAHYLEIGDNGEYGSQSNFTDKSTAKAPCWPKVYQVLSPRSFYRTHENKSKSGRNMDTFDGLPGRGRTI